MPKPSAALKAAMGLDKSLAPLLAFDSGFDAYGSPVQFSPPRRSLVRPSAPLQTYNYVLVAPRALVPVPTVAASAHLQCPAT